MVYNILMQYAVLLCDYHVCQSSIIIIIVLSSHSYFLWSVSHPGKTGFPNYDLSENSQAKISLGHGLTPDQVKLEHVIAKIFNIPLAISEATRNAFKCKLYRMGWLLSI